MWEGKAARQETGDLRKHSLVTEGTLGLAVRSPDPTLRLWEGK